MAASLDFRRSDVHVGDGTIRSMGGNTSRSRMAAPAPSPDGDHGCEPSTKHKNNFGGRQLGRAGTAIANATNPASAVRDHHIWDRNDRAGRA